ncbi:MAG: hypothetical protein KC593_13000 [Myxococcales bacterium]|nr:hypothetical protein [Myxococcales bacterium]MCB9627402.1 hypothetical protein [Sandaracinaceae bacterium]
MTTLPGPELGGRVPGMDEIDPELLALPAPPRGLRIATMGMMAVVVAAAISLALSLSVDIAYFFGQREVTQLGNATTLDPALLVPNTYVQIEGSPMLSTAVRYRRILGSDHYTLYPLAGQRNVYVQVAYEDDDQERLATRREFAGRLVTFGQLGGRFSSVRAYLETRMNQPVSADSMVLLADEPPSSYAWALGVVLLAAFIALLDSWLILRWFRPLPKSD